MTGNWLTLRSILAGWLSARAETAGFKRQETKRRNRKWTPGLKIESNILSLNNGILVKCCLI